MYITDKGNEIHIRFKKEENYIKAIVLADDTIIVNMTCDINSKIPNIEEVLILK